MDPLGPTMFNDKRTRALMMTAAMLVAAFAGCLEGGMDEGDDIVTPQPEPPVDPGTNGTDPTNGTDDSPTDNTTNTTDPAEPLDVLLSVGTGANWSTIVANISITGGESGQVTIIWVVNGVEQAAYGLQLVLENQSEGSYQINVTVTDSANTSVEKGFPLTLVADNTAPTVMLSLPTDATARQAVAWSIVAGDHENDSFTIHIDYGDGSNATALIEGFHTWTTPGTYTMMVTVRDEHGLSSIAESMITISENHAPSLDVVATPNNGGMAILLTSNVERAGDPLTLNAAALDHEGTNVIIEVDWGDGASQMLDNGTDATHIYAMDDDTEVVVIATDADGMNTTWKMQVEAVDDLEQSMVFIMQGENLPGVDDIEDELDSDGDGTVDEAADAENETGYDWQDEFDPDGDGEPNHDDDADDWTHREDSDVQSVAESDNTSARGAPRDNHGGGSNDSLTTPEEHVDNREIDGEPLAENLTDAEDIMDDLFDEEGESGGDVLEDDRLETQHYLTLVETVPAFWWNESYQADLDGNGVNESTCNRVTVLYWLDVDRDGHPERAVLIRYEECEIDIDADGTIDANRGEAWGLNYTDFNSDGDAEILHAMHLVSMVWDNETVGPMGGTIHYTDTTYEVEAFVAEDMDDDGNPEEVIIARAHLRAIDYNKDGSDEAEWVNVAVVAMEDADDDGNPDEFLAMTMEGIEIDIDGDGHPNQSMHALRIIHFIDSDSDGTPNTLIGVEYGGWLFDNNSDGRPDTSHVGWLGVRLDDRNGDGHIDKISTLQGYELVRDDDANGVAEQRSHYIAAAVVKDLDNDGNPEYVWVLEIADDAVDNDQDGAWDWHNGSFAGAAARDVDSDGHAESYVAMRVYNVKHGEHANGFSSQVSTLWVLTATDSNDDGTPDEVHAVQIFNVEWDNNSDGSPDTQYLHVEGIHVVDRDADGQVDRMVWFEHEATITNDDADADIEWSSGTHTVHARNFTAAGDTEAEYLYHVRHVRGNISTTNDTAQYENTTVIAYQTVDDGNRSFTHAVYINVESWDYDRDGEKESETVHAHSDNRT